MPWTIDDVERHNAGLSARQKKRWVAVANRVLADCQAEGGRDCEGKAVRQANSVVAKRRPTTKTLPAPAPPSVALRAAIAKADDARQQVFGWVSIANRADGSVLVDRQGDVIDIYDLEEAWYDYVIESGELNFEHVGKQRGRLVEALVITPEKLEALGLPAQSLPLGAWAGFHVPDAADYAVIKQRGYLMFSIEGSAYREEVP